MPKTNKNGSNFNAGFPPVIVTTERGELRGMALGADPKLQQVQVCIPLDTAPEWFKAAHKAPPNVWVSMTDVREV